MIPNAIHRPLRTVTLLALASGLLASAAFGQAAPPKAPPAPPAKAPAATPAAPPASAPAAAPAVPPAPAVPDAPKAMPKAPTVVPVEFKGEKPSPTAIFKKHLDAIGGEAAWSGKNSMIGTGSMRFPAIGLDAPMTIKGMLPNMMLVTIELPQQGTTRMGFDGKVGWSIDPMRGPMLLQEGELADFRRRADFRRDVKLAQEPGTSEVVGLADFNGKKVWQVKVSEADAGESINLYDQDSGLMIGTTLVAKTAMGDIPVTVVVETYGEFEGVKVPTRTVLWMLMQAQELLTKSVEWNKATAADFELPKEIAALAKAREAAPAKEAAPAPSGAAPTPPKGK